MHKANREFGEIVERDGGRTLRFVRHYAVPPSEVWSAITDPDRLGRWAFRTEIEPRTGGTVFSDLGDYGISRGTVLEWVAESILDYEWAVGSEPPWRIRFELLGDDSGGTILTFDHILPDPTQPEFAAGWHWHLDRLDLHLAGLVPPEVESDARFEELLVHYQPHRSDHHGARDATSE